MKRINAVKRRGVGLTRALLSTVALFALGCSSGAPSEPLGSVQQDFNPAPEPNAVKGHVLITQKAIEILKARGLLPPLLDDSVTSDAAKNIALLVYGNNFADHPDEAWPNLGNPNVAPSLSVPNAMTAQIPAGETLPYAAAQASFNFGTTANVHDVPTLVHVDVDSFANIDWTQNLNAESPSAGLRLSLTVGVVGTSAIFGLSKSQDTALGYAVDNLYHYGYGDLRDFNDPAITNADMRLHSYPFGPQDVPGTTDPNVTQPISANLENQVLLAGSDYGVTKYGSILYQVARRFFPGSALPAPSLADLIKVGNDVPGWHTGYLQGSGSQSPLAFAYPHTFLGGMPYVCVGATPANSPDPCATGTPTWPPWILDGASPPTTAQLGALNVDGPGRSNRAGLLYLGWATHMMQDASLPHHVAGWSGPEHQLQDDYGDQPWYYQNYSQYANATISRQQCGPPCALCSTLPLNSFGQCRAACGKCKTVITPDPRSAYAPYAPWWIDPYMAGELDALLGPTGAPKSRATICQSLGITDDVPHAGLNWESVQPVYLANAKKAYYARQPRLRDDAALAAGREYVKNAVIGTAKLLLCGIPNGPNIPAATAGAPKAALFQDISSGGRTQIVGPGIYDASWSGPHSLRSVGDNAISSLSLPAGYQATLFDQSVTSGVGRLFTSSSDVGVFNDVASSVAVTQNGESGTFFIKLKRDWNDTNFHRDFGFERYLSVQNFSGTSSDQQQAVTSSAFSSTGAEQWRYDPGTLEFTNADGLCLDDPGFGTANGTGLQVFGCNLGSNQQWQITATGQIKNMASGKCMTATDMTADKQFVLWDCNNPDGQTFDLLYNCSHDACASGAALSPSCSIDVAPVCNADPYCCNTAWDSNCVDEMGTQCQWQGDRPHGFAAHRPTSCGVFTTDQGLAPTQSWQSCDGRFTLRLGSDGNLMLWQAVQISIPFGVTITIPEPLWQTGPTGTPVQLDMQGDGNLVMYDASGNPLWSSGTPGNPGAVTQIQDDGNLVVYNASGGAVWNSNTCCH
jgi:Ricin-type beta-trefoil lectin domain